jgi:hypothetical protein
MGYYAATVADSLITRAAIEDLVRNPLALEERDDAAQLVPRLSNPSFVRAARVLHREQRLDLLLAHATPEQLTGLMDLEAWTGQRLHLPRARGWLAAIAETIDVVKNERGALTRTLYGMDPEMWTLALAPGTVVVTLDPEADDDRDRALDNLTDRRVYETPDGFFVVGVPDDELGGQALAILERVYADSLADGRKLVLSIQAALPAQIEEELLRIRNGRLADDGFVEWEEAMRLLRPYELERAREVLASDRGATAATVSDDPLEMLVFEGADLLRRAMDRLDDHEHGLRSRQFLLLVNELMAAQRFDPGDDAAQARGLAQARATVNLGLELLAMGQPQHGDLDGYLADRVRALGLRDVFRVGYGGLDRLRRAALAVHREGRVSLERVGSLLDRPWGPTVFGLARWYPELALEGGRDEELRPLNSVADLRLAAARVSEAGALAALAFASEGFAVDPQWITRADRPESVRLGDLVRTAMIHAQLPGSRTTLAPLTAQDLGWAQRELLTGDGRLVPRVRADFDARARDLGVAQHADALAAVLFPRLEAELAGLERDADGRIDPARTGGLVTVHTVGIWLGLTRLATTDLDASEREADDDVR